MTTDDGDMSTSVSTRYDSLSDFADSWTDKASAGLWSPWNSANTTAKYWLTSQKLTVH